MEFDQIKLWQRPKLWIISFWINGYTVIKILFSKRNREVWRLESGSLFIKWHESHVVLAHWFWNILVEDKAVQLYMSYFLIIFLSPWKRRYIGVTFVGGVLVCMLLSMIWSTVHKIVTLHLLCIKLLPFVNSRTFCSGFVNVKLLHCLFIFNNTIIWLNLA